MSEVLKKMEIVSVAADFARFLLWLVITELRVVKRFQQFYIKFRGSDEAVAVVNTQFLSAAKYVRRHQFGRQRAIILAYLGSDCARDSRKFITIKRHDISIR